MTVDIDLGHRIRTTDAIRVRGINAPELSQPGGKEARDFLSALIPAGTRIRIQTFKNKRDKYGRWLGDLFLENSDGTKSVNQMMIDAGHATPFMV